MKKQETESRFDVILQTAGVKKIIVIKAVREVTGLGLAEAKALTENTPSLIKANLSMQKAKPIGEKFTEAGATIGIVPSKFTEGTGQAAPINTTETQPSKPKGEFVSTDVLLEIARIRDSLKVTIDFWYETERENFSDAASMIAPAVERLDRIIKENNWPC